MPFWLRSSEVRPVRRIGDRPRAVIADAVVAQIERGEAGEGIGDRLRAVIADAVLAQIERGETGKGIGDRPRAVIADAVVAQIERGEAGGGKRRSPCAPSSPMLLLLRSSEVSPGEGSSDCPARRQRRRYYSPDKKRRGRFSEGGGDCPRAVSADVDAPQHQGSKVRQRWQLAHLLSGGAVQLKDPLFCPQPFWPAVRSAAEREVTAEYYQARPAPGPCPGHDGTEVPRRRDGTGLPASVATETSSERRGTPPAPGLADHAMEVTTNVTRTASSGHPSMQRPSLCLVICP